jgi:N-acetylmuramoyl-L-alanine amidase
LTKLFRRLPSGVILLLAALGVFLVLWPARLLKSENFVFYLPNQRRLIPISKVANDSYLPLVPVLQLTGQVTRVVEKRSSLEVEFGGRRLKFRRNHAKVQAGGFALMLQEPVVRVNGQWLAPIAFITSVLPSLTGQPVVYRPGADRAFLGGVQPISFAVKLQNENAGVELIVSFTGIITAQTASTNGRWIVFLGGAPIEPLEQEFFFQNPYLREVQFDDQDGRPKLILTPGTPGLDFYPHLTDEGRTFVAEIVNPAQARRTSTLKPAAPATASSAKPPAGAPAGAAPPLPVVVLDAGHGGADSGARSSNGVLEKNLTASLVGLVSASLAAGHQYRTVLTRQGDSDPNFGQRTTIANTARPAAFLTFHAGDLGARSPVILVYTYQPSSPPAQGSSRPSLFIPWDLAQTVDLSQSQVLAHDLQQQFAQVPGITQAQVLEAPVRQLRSVAAPAVAIEMGTLSPAQDAGQLAQPEFQNAVAHAVVTAIQQFSGAKK